METLEKQIQVVAEKRRLRDEDQRILTEARSKWESEHLTTIVAAKLSANICVESEAQLRDLTLAAYRETGNKAPAPGVGIRIGSKLLYDVAQAFTWAKQHGLALKLDAAAFEKIAKASPPDFVVTEPQVTATIASDLDAVLKEQEATK